MIDKKSIEDLLDECLESPYFAVDVKISTNNKIQVFLDGDEGLPIEVCARVSRFIESNLDRESEDFELTVSSAGADAPLLFPRQYTKHLGRTLDVYDNEGNSWQGVLKNAGDEKFSIFISRKEKDPLSGKKKLIEIEKEFGFNEVQKVKVKVLI